MQYHNNKQQNYLSATILWKMPIHMNVKNNWLDIVLPERDMALNANLTPN